MIVDGITTLVVLGGRDRRNTFVGREGQRQHLYKLLLRNVPIEAGHFGLVGMVTMLCSRSEVLCLPAPLCTIEEHPVCSAVLGVLCVQ